MKEYSPATSSVGIKDFFVDFVSPALGFLVLNCCGAVLDKDALLPAEQPVHSGSTPMQEPRF